MDQVISPQMQIRIMAEKKQTRKPQIAGQVRRIPLKDIVPSENNPRKVFNPDDLQELAESIKSNGLLQPITVRPVKSSFAKYEIVCGERRYRATQLTGSEEIDCIVKELTDKQALTAMIYENMQRQNVDPMEEAAAIDKLVNTFDETIPDVAKMLGKSETFVRTRLRLNTTIQEFVDLMHNGPLVLTHLIEICKLPAEQQKTLYESCFTPECIARWKYKFPNIPQLNEMIEANVLMQLSKATFSLKDETFEGHPACEGCPLNTKTNPQSGRDSSEPRCMNRLCFLDKTAQRIFREAKSQPVEVEIVYQGSPSESEEFLTKAEEAGVSTRPMGVRKYVIDPPEPKREDFTEEEYYLKRMHAWKHVKEVFDLGVKDGNIVPVYEICYSGHPSGELKYAYNVKTEGDTGDIEKQKLQEQIMQFKENLLNIKEKKHDELVEEYRKSIESSEYSQLNMAMTAVENDILIALLFKHLPYEFKQKLGLEWNVGRESWRQNKQALDNNRNAIKREFIRVALSDKSVNFAKDLQGMLEGLMDERYGSTKDQINDRVEEKFKKTKDQIKAKIDALKERMKPAKKSEAKETEEEPVEQPASAPETEEQKMPAEQVANGNTPIEDPAPVVEETDPAEAEAPVEPAGAELPESVENAEGGEQTDSAEPDAK